MVLELRIEIPVTLEIPGTYETRPDEIPPRTTKGPETRKWDPPYPSLR